MSIVGGPPPSLAKDVDAKPRTITDTRIALALANMVEPSTRFPPDPCDILKPTSCPRKCPFCNVVSERPAGKRRSPPLLAGQALLRPALLPIGPSECADNAAAGAHHARPERRHRHRIAIAVHIEHRFVAAELADHPQRTHALRPHVG